MANKKSPQYIDSVLDGILHDDAALPPPIGNEAAVLILERLRAGNPQRVTYAQIEDELVRAGLDPFTCTDLYDWLLEQLDQCSIKVIDDEVADNSPTVEQLTAEADELEAYYKEIREAGDDASLPLLTASEECRLLEILCDGLRAQQAQPQSTEHFIQLQRRIKIAMSAHNELTVRNQRLVFHVAKRFLYVARHLELDDLVQEGNLGLMRAIDKFDLDYGGRFSTYAVWWIRQAISRALADQERIIRLPVHRVEEIAKLRKAELQLEEAAGQKPTDETVALYLGLFQPETAEYLEDPRNLIGPRPKEIFDDIENRVRHVRKLQRVSTMDPISYDTPVKDGEDASTLVNFLPDQSAEAVEDIVCRELVKVHLREILEGLNERERKVMIMRFGLEDGVTRTLEDVGKEFEVTRERVRQIEAKALRKLRHPQRSRKLRDYLS